STDRAWYWTGEAFQYSYHSPAQTGLCYADEAVPGRGQNPLRSGAASAPHSYTPEQDSPFPQPLRPSHKLPGCRGRSEHGTTAPILFSLYYTFLDQPYDSTLGSNCSHWIAQCVPLGLCCHLKRFSLILPQHQLCC